LRYNRFPRWSVALIFALMPLVAQAGTVTVVHSFSGGPDGASPLISTPVFDSSGNLYGTTYQGGNNFGTVFKLAADGTFSTLYTFQGAPDGAYPFGTMVVDQAGSVYGITSSGGALCSEIDPTGCGTVFKISADGHESILHAFTGGADGLGPVGGLVADRSGNLYGNTEFGGGSNFGTIFKIAPDGTETVLHAFADGPTDGRAPFGSLLLDKAGNLYGTTQDGGAQFSGTVFEFTNHGTVELLHSFLGGNDGEEPAAGLALDRTGNLFGTTLGGGAWGEGTVFELAQDGTETVLHSFETQDRDSITPGYGPVILDRVGNLYGTLQGGGRGWPGKKGAIYEVTTSGTKKILCFFEDRGLNGRYPTGGLALSNGKLYGTALKGGASKLGVLFELDK
jgi:uncharacterized repeat protein (TIGR03803 family)